MGKFRILIVEDALYMRVMLREILTMGGYEVVGEACNGKEAMEQYRRCRPDLVTMDIIMPLRSGIEALQDIIAEDPQARVVMCSALGQESLLMEAAKSGASEYILKPFEKSKVLEVVSRVLAGAANFQPLERLCRQPLSTRHEQSPEVAELAQTG